MKRTVVAPNLQNLVAAFGGYDKITPEAWAEWDRACAEYQQYRRDVLQGAPPAAGRALRAAHDGG
jgi:hypothetical protein